MNMMGKMLAVVAGLVLALTGPALALDASQASTVVGLMEQVAEQSGESVYYGGGDTFFDLDYDGLIAAAGFDRDRWVVIYDEVVTGYMATIPQGEFDAIFSGVLETLEASDLSDEQKQSLRVDWEQEIGMAQQARKDGAEHAEAVRPLADRLHALFFGA